MHVKCQTCSIFHNCTSQNLITNGKLICEQEIKLTGGCSQCGESLVIGQFAYEKLWGEFWCEECIRDKYEEDLKED